MYMCTCMFISYAIASFLVYICTCTSLDLSLCSDTVMMVLSLLDLVGMLQSPTAQPTARATDRPTDPPTNQINLGESPSNSQRRLTQARPDHNSRSPKAQKQLLAIHIRIYICIYIYIYMAESHWCMYHLSF